MSRSQLRVLRSIIDDLLHLAEAEDLPVPHSLDLSGDQVEVAWMLQADLAHSRRVFRTFGPWTLHVASRPHEPIVEHTSAVGDLTVTLWCHPETFQTKLEVPE